MIDAMIVDDEQYICSLLERLIDWSALGIRLLGNANNGKDALDMIREMKPDIILTDIRMPGLDGIRLLEEIQKLQMTSLVIIISGYDDFSYAQSAVRLGAFEYILKPVEAENLQNVLLKAKEEIEKNRKNSEYITKLKRELAKMQRVREGSSDDEKERGITDAHVSVQRAIHYINENYNQDISMEQVAGSVFMNSAYFSQLFKREMGIGFNEYVTNLRMEKAKVFLKQPFLRINEVADLVGYQNTTYFNRVFKNYTGMTPTEYKEQKK